MPDISMCIGWPQLELCQTCYRMKANPNPHWQSYFVTQPIEEDGSCEYHWYDGPPKQEKTEDTGGE